MESGAEKIVESATQKILHANSFSRSSSQASMVLTDLLLRYLTLLTSTTGKYAQHAGRTRLTAKDVLCAMDELGLGLEELWEYCATEGMELGRYAVHTGRRVNDLYDFRAQLAHGLRQDHDDAIPLFFGRVSTPTPSEESDEDSEPEELRAEWIAGDSEVMQVDEMHAESLPAQRHDGFPDPRAPAMPKLLLSPVSNSSPSRKRLRTSNWQPPDYIPEFLPPFPTEQPPSPSSPEVAPVQFPPMRAPPVAIEKPSTSLLQPLSSTSSSDYLTPIPYLQSSLSSIPEWHLPTSIPHTQVIPSRTPRLLTPQTQPALIAAYHHILTHPPPPNGASANPARHKVAMALLSQTQVSPRWDPPDTLYASTAPCSPRVAPIGPTFPIPNGKNAANAIEKGKEDPKLPSMPARPVTSPEPIASYISQQPSRIPGLARLTLPASVHFRTTRLTHPPVLHRTTNAGVQKLVYGAGVPAPWNAQAGPTAAAVTLPSKEVLPLNGILNGKGKEAPPKPLPDAKLFTTWEHEIKDFREPLRRGRTSSTPISHVVPFSLGGSTRGRMGSK